MYLFKIEYTDQNRSFISNVMRVHADSEAEARTIAQEQLGKPYIITKVEKQQHPEFY